MTIDLRAASPRPAVSLVASGGGSAPATEEQGDGPASPPRSIAGRPPIMVIDHRPLIRDCMARSLRAATDDSLVLAFANVGELLDLDTTGPAAVIVLCVDSQQDRNRETARALSLLSRKVPGVPVVVVADAEHLDDVVAALKSGARGYIPTSVTLAVAVEAMRLVGAGGTYVPASSLVPSIAPRQRPTASVQRPPGLFTRRETEVVEAVRQGKANKQIAYELRMRESTVKVHVRNIMRKLRARNRTEIAVMIDDLPASADA